MNTSNYKDEFNQLNKIAKSYSLYSLKDTLLFANNSKFKLPNLNNIPQYHNIVGLINFRLNDLENSILDFEKAINLDPNFYSAYYNLGLLFFKTKNLKKSYSFLNKAIIIKNDYKLARDKIIEILSFYEPEDKNSNFISDIDKKVKQVPYEIDFSKEITDQQIINYFKNCKKVVLKDLKDLSYNKVQIYRTKSINLKTITFDKIVPKNKNIDYLSIDIEGGEMNLLKSIDFKNNNIKVISVENNVPKEQNFKNFFEKINFKYFDRIGQDEIFYNNEYFKF